jgi:hypothetical protein
LLRNAVVQVILATAFSFSACAAGIEDLRWLRGCWRSDEGGRHVTEHWLDAAGGTMLGVSRTIADGKTVAFEYMRIVQEDSGDIYFVAIPSGQKETRFKLVRSGKHDVTFENPEHDFPHRVIYRLQDGGSLIGRIEGVSKGREKAVDFPLKRVSCDL